MSKIKAGDLCILVNGQTAAMARYTGTIRTAVSPSVVHDNAWYLDPPVVGGNGLRGAWMEEDLIPIRDQPGNESWFTAAPKSLPATTKGDTITARGELA